MKRPATICVILLLAGFLFGSAVQAEPFVNPPEENHPDWVTQFPYQRNIWIGFDTDPHQWPDHETSPSSGDRKAMTPEQVHHEGTDDDDLFRSDWLGGDATGSGYTEWIDEDPDSGRKGLLKLAVDEGQGAATITLVWHIDNWDRPSDEKHFFVEAEYYTTGNDGVDTLFSSLTGGTPVELKPNYADLGDGWWRWWAQGTLKPNPLWEEMHNEVIFSASPLDSYMLIDHMHIATECVPEPGTLTLLVLGLLTLGFFGWRCRH